MCMQPIGRAEHHDGVALLDTEQLLGVDGMRTAAGAEASS